MDYTTLTAHPIASSDEIRSDLAPIISSYEALQSLPDPRRGQGKRYE